MRVHVHGIRRNFPFTESGLVFRHTLLFSAFGGIYGFQHGMNSGIRQYRYGQAFGSGILVERMVVATQAGNSACQSKRIATKCPSLCAKIRDPELGLGCQVMARCEPATGILK